MKQRLVLDILITGRSLQTHSVIVVQSDPLRLKGSLKFSYLLINNVTYVARTIPSGPTISRAKRPGNVTACKISKHLSGTVWVWFRRLCGEKFMIKFNSIWWWPLQTAVYTKVTVQNAYFTPGKCFLEQLERICISVLVFCERISVTKCVQNTVKKLGEFKLEIYSEKYLAKSSTNGFLLICFRVRFK